jgi:hypothetical protein
MEYTDFTCRQVDDTTGAASQGSILATVGWAANDSPRLPKART